MQEQPNYLYVNLPLQKVVQKTGFTSGNFHRATNGNGALKHPPDNFEQELSKCIQETVRSNEQEKKIKEEKVNDQDLEVQGPPEEPDKYYVMISGLKMTTNEFTPLIDKIKSIEKFEVVSDTCEIDELFSTHKSIFLNTNLGRQS